MTTNLPNLQSIAQKCAEQTELFFRRQAHDDSFCFELFRLAFTARNEEAWGYIYTQYDSLVTGWVNEHPQFALSQESASYFVNGVFGSMWKSCTPERFARFTNLAATLAYLKSCVHTTIFNSMRKTRVQTLDLDHEHNAEVMTVATADSPTDQILDRVARDELWRLIRGLMKNEKETRVTDLYFIKGFKPREIYERHPTEFESVREVYRIKQNLMERLSRNPELRAFYEG